MESLLRSGNAAVVKSRLSHPRLQLGIRRAQSGVFILHRNKATLKSSALQSLELNPGTESAQGSANVDLLLDPVLLELSSVINTSTVALNLLRHTNRGYSPSVQHICVARYHVRWLERDDGRRASLVERGRALLRLSIPRSLIAALGLDSCERQFESDPNEVAERREASANADSLVMTVSKGTTQRVLVVLTW